MRNFTAPYDSGNSSLWKTPLPYVLGGAIIIMALIIFALNDLVCSRRDDSDQNDDRYSEGLNTRRSGDGSDSTVEYGRKNEMLQVSTPNYSDDKEEKLIVIMAGDELPSFIAMPASVPAK